MTFLEKNYFANWVRILLVIIIALTGFGIFQNADNLALTFVLCAFLVLSTLLLFSNLSIHVSPEKISLRYFPFHLNEVHYNRSDISEIKIIKYNPISKFGGWGIRYNLQGEKIFSISGSYAIFFIVNGKKRYIGIQNVGAIDAFLKSHFSDIYISESETNV